MRSPTSLVFGCGSIALGLFVWWVLYRAAGRGVRVWILAKGRVRNGRLLRAIFLGMLPFGRARRV
ncbi:MAG: hypothetical protein EXR75_06400 [Myxococcales bacterium]|nr:hypothetical protein [Myxococcales bacterium]